MKSIERSTNGSAANSGVLPSHLRLATCGFALLIVLTQTARAETPAATRARAIAQWPAARPIDRAKLVRLGLRVLKGRHITLVTDLPSTPEVDELPNLVDAAVPLLAQRFGIDEEDLRDWHLLGSVIVDRETFAAADLLPTRGEEFPDGLSIGYELWVAEQPSDYYRRHLLLHEMTHSFMATQLGGCGPGWYMEGMAELLGTHHWDPKTKKLRLAVMPASRKVVPMWGRPKLLQQAVADQRLLPIVSVMQIDNRRALDVEAYAWVWALAKFLDTHPRYRDRFRSLRSQTLEPDFNAKFRKRFAHDWSDLETEWRLFVSSMVYGHDIEREAIDFARPAPRRARTPHRLPIIATRGWQSTGLRLEAGERYEIKASGRFVIGQEPDGTPWPCEPGGITLDYHAGHPLGQLLAVIDPRPESRPDQAASAGPRPGTSAFLHPQPIGLRTTLAPKRSGLLFLRLNDSPDRLRDNRGSATVSIRRLP